MIGVYIVLEYIMQDDQYELKTLLARVPESLEKAKNIFNDKEKLQICSVCQRALPATLEFYCEDCRRDNFKDHFIMRWTVVNDYIKLLIKIGECDKTNQYEGVLKDGYTFIVRDLKVSEHALEIKVKEFNNWLNAACKELEKQKPYVFIEPEIIKSAKRQIIYSWDTHEIFYNLNRLKSIFKRYECANSPTYQALIGTSKEPGITDRKKVSRFWDEIGALEMRYSAVFKKLNLMNTEGKFIDEKLKDMSRSVNYDIDVYKRRLFEMLYAYGEKQVIEELEALSQIQGNTNPAVAELEKRESDRRETRAKIEELMRGKGHELADYKRKKAREISEAQDEFDREQIEIRYNELITVAEQDMQRYKQMLRES